MTLEQLANIGEFLGGLAVVISLIYLAVQLRHNTTTARAAAISNNQISLQNEFLELAKSGEILSSIQARLKVDASDVGVDYLHFEFWVYSYLMVLYTQFTQVKMGLVDEELLNTAGFFLQRLIMFTEGSEQIWIQFGPSFPKEFQAWIDELLSGDNDQMAIFLNEREAILKSRDQSHEIDT